MNTTVTENNYEEEEGFSARIDHKIQDWSNLSRDGKNEVWKEVTDRIWSRIRTPNTLNFYSDLPTR